MNNNSAVVTLLPLPAETVSRISKILYDRANELYMTADSARGPRREALLRKYREAHADYMALSIAQGVGLPEG